MSGCKAHISSLVLSFKDLDRDAESISSIYSDAILPVELRPDVEAYRLSVLLSQPARIEAKSALGLYRGLTTFEQLFYHLAGSSGSVTPSVATGGILSRPNSLAASEQLPLGSTTAADTQGSGEGSKTELDDRTYAPFAPYEIEDKPAFGWRAVLLDTSRNYFSVPSILKVSN